LKEEEEDHPDDYDDVPDVAGRMLPVVVVQM
jgi:hypothetical protein